MTRLFKKRVAASALLPAAVIAACWGTPLPALADTPAPVASAPTATTIARPAMWVVKDDDTTIHLFGTVHLLRPDMQWLDGRVKAAFDASDTLVLEVILPTDPAEVMAVMGPHIGNPGAPPLTSQMEPAQRDAYVAAVKAIGVDPAVFEDAKPWFPAINLAMVPLMQAGFSPDAGAEAVLTTAAKASGKTVTALETAAEQFGFFGGMAQPVQLAFLNQTVADLPKMMPQFEQLMAHWAAGEADALGAMLNASMANNPEVADVLLFQRNARWAEWIKARLDTPGTVFVAVGAGHLAGEKSVQDYLATAGIVAERSDQP